MILMIAAQIIMALFTTIFTAFTCLVAVCLVLDALNPYDDKHIRPDQRKDVVIAAIITAVFASVSGAALWTTL